MSLLLDALKKAAADKNTSNNTAVPEKISASPEETSIDIAQEKHDKLSLSDTKKNKKTRPKENFTPEKQKSIDVDKNTSSKTGETPPLIQPTPSELKDKVITDVIPLQEKTKPAIETPTTRSEEDLIELINKSNKYSRYESTKRNITIGLFLLLTLAVSGLYFYYQIDMADQNIYITDNTNEISSYDLVDEKIALNEIVEMPTETSPPKKVTPKKSQVKAPSKSKRVIKKLTVKPIPKNTSINIIKTKSPDPINSILRKAYNEFHNKNYTSSESLYYEVLSRDAQNRNALLGLSAIGIKTNRYEFSRQKYLYLLKLNPRDNLAIAGLSSLDSNANSQLTESKLKFLLKQHPDAAHLYFALGTLFSKQNKWPEAQSAYFSAWSANNENPDYTYNLAVSLDHLDKKSQALKFYTLSLKLQKSANSNFSTTQAQKRINTLAMEL